MNYKFFKNNLNQLSESEPNPKDTKRIETKIYKKVNEAEILIPKILNLNKSESNPNGYRNIYPKNRKFFFCIYVFIFFCQFAFMFSLGEDSINFNKTNNIRFYKRIVNLDL